MIKKLGSFFYELFNYTISTHKQGLVRYAKPFRLLTCPFCAIKSQQE